MNNWFEVDRKGLKALQDGKPKHYVLRELVQNAWDEKITKCDVVLMYDRPVSLVEVVDDNPEGFKNLRDAFTLFGDTEKRRDATKRGRFNLGEKQAIAICKSAAISTTKGTVTFSKKGRKVNHSKKMGFGSSVALKLKLSMKEYDEMLEVSKAYLTPKGIIYTVNGEDIPYIKPDYVVEDTLPTQFEVEGQMRDTERKTNIHVLKQDKSYLYEMGLPVLEIDCPYSIDVQQKIPMSADRETVKPSYLKKVFAIVLNNTIDDIDDESSSETWIRVGSGDKSMTEDTMKKLVHKRFGDKVVVSNPMDRVSNDDALANGFRVINGRELSKEEWDNIKEYNLVKSSTALFGRSAATDVKSYAPDGNMLRFADMATRIARRFMNKVISVNFYTSKQVTEAASYGGGDLSVNVTKLGKRFFENVTASQIELIVHELGHEAGMHTEESYHKLLTTLAGELTMLALKEPEFFEGVR